MDEFPLHSAVFNNDTNRLNSLLAQNKNSIDQKDLRGKTPLELAVLLNHFESAQILVENGADCNIITKQGWNLIQESVSTGNRELVKLMLKYRDYQRSIARTNGIADILNKLKQAPDFYVEMKWQFHSWIPLVAKACPSDVYKIYKSGSNVRIDTTLIGFNGTTWERGNRSYIFQAINNEASITEIDHLTNSVITDRLKFNDGSTASGGGGGGGAAVSGGDDNDVSYYEPDDSHVDAKLASPNMTTYLDVDKIEFERNRSGIWGWRTDKLETINGYECKVYTANNLQLITKTRIEHLDDSNSNEKGSKSLHSISNSNIPSFLTSIFHGNEEHIKTEKPTVKLSPHEYFSKYKQLSEYLDRKIDENKKIQTFNATLSLCDDYPLSLHEQILPIVDLMALSNSHFKKLKEFITLQLPSGFPVKIEIPLYRVITAKVTFANIHAIENKVNNVTTIKENDQVMCIVDETVFNVPKQYKSIGPDTLRHYTTPVDDDDILLQLAIQQSLAGTGGAEQQGSDEEQLTALEMFGYRSNTRQNNYNYDYGTDEDLILQRVLAESLRDTKNTNTDDTGDNDAPLIDFGGVQQQQQLHHHHHQRNQPTNDGGLLMYDLTQALEQSRREDEERERLRKEEEEELERILQLSLVEK